MEKSLGIVALIVARREKTLARIKPEDCHEESIEIPGSSGAHIPNKTSLATQFLGIFFLLIFNFYFKDAEKYSWLRVCILGVYIVDVVYSLGT